VLGVVLDRKCCVVDAIGGLRARCRSVWVNSLPEGLLTFVAFCLCNLVAILGWRPAFSSGVKGWQELD